MYGRASSQSPQNTQADAAYARYEQPHVRQDSPSHSFQHASESQAPISAEQYKNLLNQLADLQRENANLREENDILKNKNNKNFNSTPGAERGNHASSDQSRHYPNLFSPYTTLPNFEAGLVDWHEFIEAQNAQTAHVFQQINEQTAATQRQSEQFLHSLGAFGFGQPNQTFPVPPNHGSGGYPGHYAQAQGHSGSYFDPYAPPFHPQQQNQQSNYPNPNQPPSNAYQNRR